MVQCVMRWLRRRPDLRQRRSGHGFLGVPRPAARDTHGTGWADAGPGKEVGSRWRRGGGARVHRPLAAGAARASWARAWTPGCPVISRDCRMVIITYRRHVAPHLVGSGDGCHLAPGSGRVSLLVVVEGPGEDEPQGGGDNELEGVYCAGEQVGLPGEEVADQREHGDEEHA